MRWATLIFFFILSFQLLGQNASLANNYYRNGEYEKAAEIFRQLMDKNAAYLDSYMSRYIECLVSLNQYDEAKSYVKKKQKKAKIKPVFNIYLGDILEREGNLEGAIKQYDKAVGSINANHAFIARTANTFQRYKKYKYAIATYEKGLELLDQPTVYAMQLANLYRLEGDQGKMIEYYLLSVQNNETTVERLQSLFARYVDKDDLQGLVQQLYILIQDYPDDLRYLELLEWVYIQKGDYKNALRQAKAIDKRSNGLGVKVFNLGTIAHNARDYDAAINAFEYIVDDLGRDNPYFMDAQIEMLNCKRDKIVKGRKFEVSELDSLRRSYESFINEWNYTPRTAPILLQWANLEARYGANTPKAIELLEKIIEIPQVDRFVLNNAKLDLGDAYLIKGEIWEATLLYGQVDKEFREDYLGEQARYKNAKLYYYQGDFEWAQAQFDILKAATSRLISNDAIDQSVFIMDNLGLDTTPVPLQMYARAELLQYQNQYDNSFAVLDSITDMFPNHGLEDDIWYLKANVFRKQKAFDQAINYYSQIVDRYPEEIRADNALYEMAQIYEIYLDEPEKALPLYEKLFIEFSGSTLAVDARKKFRILRGDDIVQ